MNDTFVVDLGKRIGEHVRFHGWVQDVRSTRTMQFVQLRDRTGVVQGVLKRGANRTLERVVESLQPESAVRVAGLIKNTSAGCDSFEVVLETIDVLGACEGPLPLGKAPSPETRLDYRYLDLRSPGGYLIFEVGTTFVAAVREYLLTRRFIELHSPKISAGGSESGAGVFEVPYFDNTGYLIQSTQFYKQMAMAAGFDRVFEIGPIFRAERSNTPRHATEFTCIDFEISWIDTYEELMTFEEELLHHALRVVRDQHGDAIERCFGIEVEVPETPIPRVTFDVALSLGKTSAASGENDGRLSHIAEQLVCRNASEKFGQSYVFITEFPATQRPFYHMRLDDGTSNGEPRTRSFDLLWRGIEITTGGQREHRYDVLRAQTRAAGIEEGSLATYLEPYFLEMFRWGCPPHGGFGIGLERLLMALLARQSLRETAFVFRDSTRLVP